MNNDKSLFFAGVHWGRGFHQVCVIDRNSSVLGEKTFKHGGRELCEMARWLTELCGASPEVIAVGIEVPRGPVVESLLEGGFCVHSVTPRQLDRFRDRFCASGAKDFLSFSSVKFIYSGFVFFNSSFFCVSDFFYQTTAVSVTFLKFLSNSSVIMICLLKQKVPVPSAMCRRQREDGLPQC